MNEQSIFLAALDIADPTQRNDYLTRVCGGDPALREQVDDLLAAHEGPGEFLEQPVLRQMAAGEVGVRTSAEHGAVEHGLVEQGAAESEVDLSFLQPATAPGSLGRLGHYDVQQIIGRCGIVLKAFDETLQPR